MDYRTLLVSAVLATGLGGFTQISRADLIAVGDGIAVEKSDVSTPARGMSMNQVASKFGEPTTKVPAVGKPPISRWDYPGFVVYFDHQYVIHTVVSDSAQGAAAPASPAPASAAPDAAPSADATPAPAN
jgi:hypothetical protein